MSGTPQPAGTGAPPEAEEDAEQPLLSPTLSLGIEAEGGTPNARRQAKAAAAAAAGGDWDGEDGGPAGCLSPAAFAQVRRQNPTLCSITNQPPTTYHGSSSSSNPLPALQPLPDCVLPCPGLIVQTLLAVAAADTGSGRAV